MAEVSHFAPTPRLILLETQDTANQFPPEIEFKFQAQDMTEDAGSAWGSSTGMNRPEPILQYSHGNQRGFQFGMRLFAQHSDDDIDGQIKLIKQACLKDDKLNRPPRWQFIWGGLIDETVVIETVGGIKYDEIRPDGTARGATFSIKLLIYKSIDVALVAEDRPTDTFFVAAKKGDHWEDLALREYGDPSLGEILRRRNPALLFPGNQPAVIVKLPKLENIRNEVIEPDSIPLRRTAEALALRSKVYESRSAARETTVLKK